MGDPDTGELLQDAAGAHAERSVHLLNGVAGDMAHCPYPVRFVIEAVGDGLGEIALERLVEGDGHVELLADGPQAVVFVAMPVAASDGVRV